MIKLKYHGKNRGKLYYELIGEFDEQHTFERRFHSKCFVSIGLYQEGPKLFIVINTTLPEWKKDIPALKDVLSETNEEIAKELEKINNNIKYIESELSEFLE